MESTILWLDLKNSASVNQSFFMLMLSIHEWLQFSIIEFWHNQGPTWTQSKDSHDLNNCNLKKCNYNGNFSLISNRIRYFPRGNSTTIKLKTLPHHLASPGDHWPYDTHLQCAPLCNELHYQHSIDDLSYNNIKKNTIRMKFIESSGQTEITIHGTRENYSQLREWGRTENILY